MEKTLGLVFSKLSFHRLGNGGPMEVKSHSSSELR